VTTGKFETQQSTRQTESTEFDITVSTKAKKASTHEYNKCTKTHDIDM